MMDINLIDKTIEELENSDTNFSNCADLASLYIVRDHLKCMNEVESELHDISPHYKNYCDTKRKYQMNELTYDYVINAMKGVCREISEFVLTLYRNTELKQERDLLNNLLDELAEKVR